MEKKQYIMPSVRVKAVNVLTSILDGSLTGKDETGSGEELSKEINLSEDNGNEGVATHDVWED